MLSSTSISKFLPIFTRSIVGTFDRPEISISSAEGKAVDDETLTQKSKLNMQGALAEQVVTPTPIGEILVTLQE